MGLQDKRSKKTHSITPTIGQRMDLQNRIVRRHRLKRDICMPPIAGEFTRFGQRVNGGGSTFLLLDAADYGDLVTELAVCFGDGVDVET